MFGLGFETGLGLDYGVGLYSRDQILLGPNSSQHLVHFQFIKENYFVMVLKNYKFLGIGIGEEINYWIISYCFPQIYKIGGSYVL